MPQTPFSHTNNRLLGNTRFLTDGGMETTFIFHEGVSLNHFASFELLNDAGGRALLHRYYRQYLGMAVQYQTGFILEAPTWRANPDWGFKLGYTPADLDAINRQAIAFLRELKQLPEYAHLHTLISGCIGPRGDGYQVEHCMRPEEAKAYHLPQIKAFADAGADLASAFTMNYREEALGVVYAAQEAGIPAVISFTLETDGRLPNGERLQDAIQYVDALSASYPEYYMINCAHPEHFKDILENSGDWINRIGAIRGNASTKSHAELDACETLDTGDKTRFARGYRQLATLLPNLRVVGGCCGTDHTHIEEVAKALF